MKKTLFIILFSIILLSCQEKVTAPNNSSSESTGESDTTVPSITPEDTEQYGIDIDTAASENVRAALVKYHTDKGEYKLIFKGNSTKTYDSRSNLGAIIAEVKDINGITVSLEHVNFIDNKLPDFLLGGDQTQNNNITKVILPDTIKVIGNKVFFNCYALTEINMPKSLTEIGSYFIYNTKIKNIDLPNGLTTIKDHAFYVSSIESINIPDTVTSIGASAFDSCQQLKSVKLPNNLTIIAESLFASCYKLTTMNIPESVTKIESDAFYVCKGLDNVIFEGSPKITSIGNSAFGYCKALTSITIPASVTSIGNSAFSTCDLLTTITFLSQIPPSITGNNTFNNSSSLKNIYVPYGAKTAYEALKGNSLPANVVITENI
ncbi:leucine-rich repeat domain-containing protein [uncultured Brachyspira sp.]|uniref:leucine-rich repeat domain-containing protein n=1 Tax=uncultured Brachyspira sp. TaxID=221953 RepID=UPI002605CAEF|nr:leucine-rich repeat domain-containing protein [uncultured Brachyspira sp.]